MESPKRKKFKLKPILPHELTENIPLVDIYAGVLREKRIISQAVQSISRILPGFHHLKRCDGKRLLLDWVNPEKPSESELKQRLCDKGFDLSLLLPDFEVVKVLARPPKTRTQAAKGACTWPLNFRPDKNVEEMLSGSMFSDKILESIENCMKVVTKAWEIASQQENSGVKECSGSCMLVDAKRGNIVSLANARINEHPMWHSSMLAIDLVARFQGGGAWNLRSCPGKLLGKAEKRKFNEEKTLVYPENLNELRSLFSESLFLNMEMKKSKGKKQESSLKKEEFGFYLCTGFWAFLLQEPCSLCAMALLHSRVSRIFYLEENPVAGVLESKAILHSLPGLNHRYKVWKASLE